MRTVPAWDSDAEEWLAEMKEGDKNVELVELQIAFQSVIKIAQKAWLLQCSAYDGKMIKTVV